MDEYTKQDEQLAGFEGWKDAMVGTRTERKKGKAKKNEKMEQDLR